MRFKYIDPYSLNNFKINLKSGEEKEANISKLKDAVENNSFPINDFFLVKGDQDLKIYPKELYSGALDFEIAKWLYDSLDIERVEASMPEFWTYISLKYLWSFLISSLKVNTNEDNWFNKLESIFIFTSSQNNLMSHPLASLWWTVELFNEIKDISDSDRNELLKVFLKDKNLRDKNFGKHQLIRNPEILRGIIQFYKDHAGADYKGKRLPTEAFAQQLMKFVNHRAGANLVSLWSYLDVYNFLTKYKYNIYEATLNVGERKVVSRLKMEDKRQNELFFNLNSATGNYIISKFKDADFDFNLKINASKKGQFIYHFYKEGKIKKTLVGDEILNKRQGKLYKNGKNHDYSLVDCFVADDNFLIGIYHQFGGVGYIKLHEMNSNLFRSDNEMLHQEGKKINGYQNTSSLEFSFKRISMEYKDDLERLIFASSTSSGKSFDKLYYHEQQILTEVWPEIIELID